MINIENISYYLVRPMLPSTPPPHYGDEARRAGRTRQCHAPHLRQPTRRNFRSAIPAAIMVPVIPAMPAAEPSAVSPKLGGLIIGYQHSAATLEAIIQGFDPSAWDEAGVFACRGLKARLGNRPVTVAGFTAKINALIKAARDDGDLYLPRTLEADLRARIGEDER